MKRESKPKRAWFWRFPAILASVGLLSGGTASAQTLIAPDVYAYTSEASYDSATTIQTTIAFDSLTSATGFVNDGSSLSDDGVAFNAVSSGTDLFVIGGQYDKRYDIQGDGTATLDVQYGAPDLVVTLPSGSSAVGTELATTLAPGTITATLTLAGVATPVTFNYTSSQATTNGLGFLGFDVLRGGTIQSISFTDTTTGGLSMTYDNFTTGLAVAPEPAPLNLFFVGASALACCVAARCRRLGRMS